MEQHLDWKPDLPLPSIEDFIDPRILEDRTWEPNFELAETSLLRQLAARMSCL